MREPAKPLRCSRAWEVDFGKILRCAYTTQFPRSTGIYIYTYPKPLYILVSVFVLILISVYL